jgi:HPt (histidine-containing phosphotransfer) domain-containing protein
VNDGSENMDGSTPPILDTAFVRDLMRQIGKGGRQILGELVETFASDTIQQLDLLGAEKVNREAVLRCAHRIRGAAGGIGATGMQTFAAMVEAQLVNNEPIDPDLIPKFRDLLTASQAAFAEILAAP